MSMLQPGSPQRNLIMEDRIRSGYYRDWNRKVWDRKEGYVDKDMVISHTRLKVMSALLAIKSSCASTDDTDRAADILEGLLCYLEPAWHEIQKKRDEEAGL